ncbi:MAG: hypothetical protein JNK51_00825 [Blastocatellia bacterium]|nr:hypothetical protein [Chloracidobacterium sp.]MBL8183444.1 hypothetical protein [Blastocatellia bacterium]HRJ87110.1 hypothetical protein [Pyrinomonadaceae bacterium]HRK52027.1 hypothetical protein [Pyrinomonadaceae bacterium]
MLSFLTQPNYPQAAIGIEIDSISVVALQRESRGVFSLKQAASVELPNGLVNPNFTEKNISSPVQFRISLEEATASAGMLNQRSWSVSLPSNSARSAILTLENGVKGKAENEEVLDWKAEQAFGTPAAQLRISRHKIAPDPEGRARFLATAVKLSVIDEFETVFEELGWKAGLILPRAICEANWLLANGNPSDTLLISSQSDGFTAFLIRDREPNVIRTVTCTEAERDDEIYRLLMFYNDRFAENRGDLTLGTFLSIGADLVPAKIREISMEALGRALTILRPEDVGMRLPSSGGIRFDSVAAPAALASLGWR